MRLKIFLICVYVCIFQYGCTVYDLKKNQSLKAENTNNKTENEQIAENIKNMEKENIPTNLVFPYWGSEPKYEKTKIINSHQNLHSGLEIQLICKTGSLDQIKNISWTAVNNLSKYRGDLIFHETPIILDLNPILVWDIELRINNKYKYKTISKVTRHKLKIDCI